MVYSGCDELRTVISAQLPALFDTRALDDECRVTTPLSLPDGELVAVWVSKASDGLVTVRDDGLAGNALYLGGIGPRVIMARLRAASARFGLDQPEDEELARRVDESRIAFAVVAVAQAVVDASGILLQPQKPRTTKDFHTTLEGFFVRNGWLYQPTRLVQGRRRRRRVDYFLNQGPRQLMLLTFQPGSEHAAETRLDEIIVTAFELSEVVRDTAATLAVFVDDRSDALTPIEPAWMQTLNDLLPGQVVSYSDRQRFGELVGQTAPVRG